MGGPADNSNAGAVWVWTRNLGMWTQQGAKLVGTGAVGMAFQGYSVALSADGNTALVGGGGDNSNSGAVWVWTRTFGAWTQQGTKLAGTGAAGNAQQGYSVALSGDGNTALVGGPIDNSNSGAVWVWTRSGGAWTQQGSKLVGAGAVGTVFQGWSVALSTDGNTALVGGPVDNGDAGAAWVWTRSGNVWIQQGSKLVGAGAVGNAAQGSSVALSANGNTALVGGNGDSSSTGAAWMWTRSGVAWAQQGSKLVGTGAVGPAAQGYSVALSADAKTVLVAGPSDNNGAGAVWVYTPAGALQFVPVTPCRVVDTRNATGQLGGPAIAGGTIRDFTVPSSACGIPTTAQAYSLNLTVVPHGSLGYITVWPTGETQPVVSTMNSLDGRVKANAAIIAAGTDGAISAIATNETDLVMDINGYFVAATALDFYPLTPCRVADTRNANGQLGGPFLTGGASRVFPVQSSSCNIPATAQAYSLNFTAIPHGPLGYLTTWPTGQTQPFVSTLNALTGTITANAAIVPAGTSGNIDVFATNNTDLAIDINGYFAPVGAGGQSLYTLAPCRVLDTRAPSGSPPFTGQGSVNVAGSSCGVSATAEAYIFNATVVPSGPLGYLTLWPQGQTQPVVSTLNALDGAVTSNMAIVSTTNGFISAFANSPTHLVLDIFGYFAP